MHMASISLYTQRSALPAEMKVSCRKRSLNTPLITWWTETVSMSPSPVLGGDRRAQLQTSSTSLVSGWTPNILATRLSGTGAWAQAARRTKTYSNKGKWELWACTSNELVVRFAKFNLCSSRFKHIDILVACSIVCCCLLFEGAWISF